jgi:4a-hydroxytetrahydrobiopterin dehydratase
MKELKDRKCVTLSPGAPSLDEKEIGDLLRMLPRGWEVVEKSRIRKAFSCKNFMEGMNFAREIARLAEEENHHPDLCIHYTGVEVEFSTHSVGGLSENDFIMAAKIEDI